MNARAIEPPRLCLFGAIGWIAMLAMFAIGLGTYPALAVNESVYQAISGAWLLADEGSDAACVVTLSAASGRHGVSGAGHCSGELAAAASAVTWDLDTQGGLTLRNGQGKGLLRLAQDLDGQYYQPNQPKGERIVLMAANEGSERLISVEEMTGRWAFERPDGKPVCDVAFSGTLLSSKSGFRGFSVSPECDASLKKLNLVKWHIEGALLVLVGSETADLTLVPKADGSFVKSAKEGGKPLVLEKK